MKTESIIFDLDGTLWDSSDNVAASWMETISAYPTPFLKKLNLTPKDIKAVMGLPMDEIAAKLFPMLSVTMQADLSEKCLENENNFLATKGGILFENIEQTLSKLSNSHRLFIVSNCQCGYIEAFFEYHKLERYFTNYLCWGDTGAEKAVTIKRLMDKNKVCSAVYVGDTLGDCTAAEKAEIPFVYASYGFGDVPFERCAAVVSSPIELVDVFEE